MIYFPPLLTQFHMLEIIHDTISNQLFSLHSDILQSYFPQGKNNACVPHTSNPSKFSCFFSHGSAVDVSR